MRRVRTFLLGILVGGLLLLAATRYHFVRAADGFHWIPRIEAGLVDSFCDIRQFGVGDWAEHQDLALAILKADRHDIFETTVFRSMHGQITGFAGETTWH